MNLKICKRCHKEKNIQKFGIVKNKDTKKPYHRNICKGCRNNRQNERRKNSEIRYKSYIYDAKKRNLNFNLTIEQFKEFENIPCFYCGEQTDFVGLDRVNNSKGYTSKNVVSCCKRCNYIKHTYSKDEFLLHVEKIYNHQERMKND